MRQQDRTVEQELARLAEPAHGVVRRSDLEAAGVTGTEIRTRMRRGTLIRVHRGVYGTTPADAAAVLVRRPRSRMRGNLRAVIHGDEPVLLSALERRFPRLLREAGLPLPVTNCPAGGRRADCRWPEHRLTVELDSCRFHRSRHVRERDRRRAREARARGDDFRRFTFGDVERPRAMLTELSSVLS